MPSKNSDPNRPHSRMFEVTKDDIANGLARSSRYCPISDVVARSIPYALRVDADVTTIRWSDPGKRKRYIFITPLSVRQFIVDFDQGNMERVKPFRFRLGPPAQIVPMRDRPSDQRGPRKPRKKPTLVTNGNGKVTQHGGRLLYGNSQRYRKFGSRDLIF